MPERDHSDDEGKKISRRRVLQAAGSAAGAAIGGVQVAQAGPAAGAPAAEQAAEEVEVEELDSAWNDVAGADQREFPLNDPKLLEIFGYTEWLSYEPGESVRLFVHTTAPTYEIEVLRDGLKPLKVWSMSGARGVRQQTPDNAYAVGCGWGEPVVIAVDVSWPSGFYLIILRAIAPNGKTMEREAGFVLRPKKGEPRGRIALIVRTATATAYNDWGGGNSYRTIVDGRSKGILAPRLSLQRPWGRGFLRLPVGAPRHSETPDLAPFASPIFQYVDWALTRGYSRHCSDAGWAYYERPFVIWLERNWYALDYFTQHDLQFRPDCLDGYPCAVIMGHDEYWSWEMRDTIEAFTRKGGRVARFGGNFLWQVRIEDGGRTQVAYKATPDPDSASAPTRTTTNWDAKIVNRPAATTFGLTGVGGIYVRTGATTPRAPGGFTIYRPDHWVFEGTDAYYGDMFGAAPSRILAFEVDGVDYTFRGGLPYPTHVDAAPESLQILAMAPAVRGEPPARHGGLIMAPLEMPSKDHWPLFYDIENLDYGAAMMSVMSAGAGEVFTAGCCGWMDGLTHNDFVVTTITKNVLDRFSRAHGSQ